MRRRSFVKSFLFLPVAAAFILLLIKGDAAAVAARNGAELCFRSVIPALFPTLVITNLLLRIGLPDSLLRGPGVLFERVFGIRRTVLPAFLTGLLGGYPVGAEAAAECCRLGGCSEEEAGRLLIFSNNCSPAFLFGMLGSHGADGKREALLLLVLQWSISIWLGAFLGSGHAPKRSSDGNNERITPSFPVMLASSVRNGTRSMLLICAYVIFFSVITSFLPAMPLLRGLFELTGGILLMDEGQAHLVTAAFLIGWGGLSVACQVCSALENSHIHMGLYLPLRLLHGVLMAFCVLLIRYSPLLVLPFVLLLMTSVFVKRSRKQAHTVV